MEPYNWVRVDFGVMATKEYSTFPKLQNWNIRCSLISYLGLLLAKWLDGEMQLADWDDLCICL